MNSRPLYYAVLTHQHCMAHHDYDRKQLQRRCSELRAQQEEAKSIASSHVGFRLPCLAAGVTTAHIAM